MYRFLLRRLLMVIITLALVSVILFCTAQLLPGDVGRSILGPFATNAQVAQLDRQLGVDRPLLVRYGAWVGGFLTGHWGTSVLLNVPVASIVFQRLLHSLILGGFALVLIVIVSVGLGVLAALRAGTWVDRLITVTGQSLIALPEFVGGIVLLSIFAVALKWFPVSSSVPSLNPVDWFRQLLLPSIPLVFVLFGYISRMARAGTVDALRSNYARTAVLKGLPRGLILRRHVLRNSLVPTITVIAVQTGYLIGGLVVTETLFNYPGIGLLIYDSAVHHDLPVLQASVLLIATVYVLLNLSADLIYAVLNPRIRVASA